MNEDEKVRRYRCFIDDCPGVSWDNFTKAWDIYQGDRKKVIDHFDMIRDTKEIESYGW